MGRAWHITTAADPLVATAIHAGHEMREEVHARMVLSDEARLREEDPFTDAWTLFAPSRIVVIRSRFEVDLNRPREGAVYRGPSDAWDLDLWDRPLEEDLVERSLGLYDTFYQEAAAALEAVISAQGFALVIDVHSYNHRRQGAGRPPDDPASNPDINLGTGTLDRARWAAAVDVFADALRAAPVPDGSLDVRENVKFRGGHFSTWVHERFAQNACVIAVEVKKTFMDEWTGVLDVARHGAIGEALQTASGAALSAARASYNR